MAKDYRKVITVRGTLAFPIDMLRYDHAWPRTEQDALKIQSCIEAGGTYGRQEIELVSLEMPNRDRWSSFGWEVVRTERVV